MMQSAENKAKPRAMKLTELANAYGVCTRTLKKWLKKQNIETPTGTQFFTVAEVNRIFESIGEP